MKLTLLTPDGQAADSASAYFDEEGGTVGRAPANSLVLSGDANVSQVQLAIELVHGSWMLKDLGDLLPVFHNDKPLGYGVRANLADADRLRIGNFELVADLHASRPIPARSIPAASPVPTPQVATPPSLPIQPLMQPPVQPAPEPVPAPQRAIDPFDFGGFAPSATPGFKAATTPPQPFIQPVVAPVETSQRSADPFDFADLAPVAPPPKPTPVRPAAVDPFENLLSEPVKPATTTAALNDGGGSLSSLLGSAAGAGHAALTPVGQQADSLDMLFGLQVGSGADPLAPGGIFDRSELPMDDSLGLARPPVAPSTLPDHAPGIYSSMSLSNQFGDEPAHQPEPPVMPPAAVPESLVKPTTSPIPKEDSLDDLFGLG